MSTLATSTKMERPWRLNTRRIVTAGVLGAIAILLGVTRIGFIPVPNITGSATIMHIPAILGGALEGPVVGALTGGIFGIYSFSSSPIPLFKDPLVSILPRIFIGIIAWLAFVGIAPFSRTLAAAVSGIAGTLTNTILVVGIAILRNYIPLKAIPLILPQAIAELVIATVITVIVVRGVDIVRGSRIHAADSVPRDKSYY